MTEQVTIGWLYPAALSTYGDRGNVLALSQRARWRSIEPTVIRIDPNDPMPRDVDVLVVGGGQDKAQTQLAERLVRVHGGPIRERLSEGVALLAICAGYQLLCHEFVTVQGKRVRGVGVFDAMTRAFPGRLVGDVRVSTRWGEVVGFENHSGRTYLGASAEPMGRVLSGHGNNGEDRTEGVICGRAVGSYLHGPLLPRNAALTDWLLLAALQRRYPRTALEPLPDRLEQATHAHFISSTRSRFTAGGQPRGGPPTHAPHRAEPPPAADLPDAPLTSAGGR